MSVELQHLKNHATCRYTPLRFPQCSCRVQNNVRCRREPFSSYVLCDKKYYESVSILPSHSQGNSIVLLSLLACLYSTTLYDGKVRVKGNSVRMMRWNNSGNKTTVDTNNSPACFICYLGLSHIPHYFK